MPHRTPITKSAYKQTPTSHKQGPDEPILTLFVRPKVQYVICSGTDLGPLIALGPAARAARAPATNYPSIAKDTLASWYACKCCYL